MFRYIKSQQETKKFTHGHGGRHFQKKYYGPIDLQKPTIDFLEMPTPLGDFLCLLLRPDVKKSVKLNKPMITLIRTSSKIHRLWICFSSWLNELLNAHKLLQLSFFTLFGTVFVKNPLLPVVMFFEFEKSIFALTTTIETQLLSSKLEKK